MRFSPTQLEHPIVQAPMGGGPSTPALAAVVSEAGGLGVLAAGYRSAAVLRDDIAELRRLTERPFGVNLFVPGPTLADPGAIDAYASTLANEGRALRRARRCARRGSEAGRRVYGSGEGWSRRGGRRETMRICGKLAEPLPHPRALSRRSPRSWAGTSS